MSILLAWRMAVWATVLTAFGSASLLAQTVAKEQAPMRIAVVCDREIVEGDQMLSYLTERGYDLLERTDLALIVKEGRLTREMLSGDLARADALVVIEVVSVLEDDFLATRVVVCKDGRIHGSDLRLREDAGRAWCGVVDGQLRDFQRRVKKGEEERLRVSVQAVREEYEAGRTENPLLGRALADMVVSGLSEQPQIEVLERGDLGLVQLERLLTPIDWDTFAGADRVVTASFKREEGSARIVIQVAGTQGGANLEESATVESDEYPGIAKAIVERALPLILRGSSEGGAELRIRRFSGSKEAERFAEEAERALRLGLHDHAAEFAETAYLLDDDDAGNHLYLVATAELLASMPGLRGRGLEVDRGFGFQSGPSGAPERIDLISEMVDGRDYEEFPLPDEGQWEVIALSAERSADLVNRARRDNGSLDGTKALYFRGSLTPLLNEVVMNSFVRYRQGIPGHEREMLRRIAGAVWRPSEGPGTPVQRLSLDFLRSPYDVLILESSREAAVGTIRHWLYGPHLSELAEKEGPETLDLRERAEHLRRVCFTVFEYEG